jgi:hypothetical protein
MHPEIDPSELSLRNVPADVLGRVLEHIELPGPEGEPSDEWNQTKALMSLAVLAW